MEVLSRAGALAADVDLVRQALTMIAQATVTVAQRPPAARGVRVRVPSWAWVMLLTIARPRPTPAWSVADAFGAALERFGECRDQLRGELLAGVLDREHDGLGADAVLTCTVPCSGRLWTMALCTRFVVICSRSACEPMVGVDVPGGLDGDAVLFGEGEERFGGFFRDEGQVDVFSGEGSLVGAAEQEQCLGEVDRSGVDGAEAFDRARRCRGSDRCGRRREGSA